MIINCYCSPLESTPSKHHFGRTTNTHSVYAVQSEASKSESIEKERERD